MWCSRRICTLFFAVLPLRHNVVSNTPGAEQKRKAGGNARLPKAQMFIRRTRNMLLLHITFKKIKKLFLYITCCFYALHYVTKETIQLIANWMVTAVWSLWRKVSTVQLKAHYYCPYWLLALHTQTRLHNVDIHIHDTTILLEIARLMGQASTETSHPHPWTFHCHCEKFLSTLAVCIDQNRWWQSSQTEEEC